MAIHLLLFDTPQVGSQERFYQLASNFTCRYAGEKAEKEIQRGCADHAAGRNSFLCGISIHRNPSLVIMISSKDQPLRTTSNMPIG